MHRRQSYFSTYMCLFNCQRKNKKIIYANVYWNTINDGDSSRKLNNNKVITTACNCCRQIACPFQFYVGTNHHDNSCAKSTRKTLFWISRFFHLTNSDVTNCFCRQFFRPFYEDKGQKTVISNCEYLRDACFNWAETSYYVYLVHIKHIWLELN